MMAQCASGVSDYDRGEPGAGGDILSLSLSVSLSVSLSPQKSVVNLSKGWK